MAKKKDQQKRHDVEVQASPRPQRRRRPKRAPRRR